MAAAQVIGMGGALQALWAATGSALGAVSVLGEAAAHGAQALNNLAIVAEETSGSYLDETRANRLAAKLLLDRKQQRLELENPAPVQAPVIEAQA